LNFYRVSFGFSKFQSEHWNWKVTNVQLCFIMRVKEQYFFV